MKTTPQLLQQPPIVSGHWKTFAVIILIFAFGCFSGALSMSEIARHHAADALLRSRGDVAAVLERRLLHEITLEDGQKIQAHALFAADGQRRRQLETQIHPQIQAIDHETVARMDALLNPEQREQFHRNIAQLTQHLGTRVFDPADAAAPASRP